MKRKQKNYTREFKLEAIHLWQNTDKSAREIAEDLGISRGSLYRWKRELDKKGEDAFPGHGRMAPAEEEIRRLRRELAFAKRERDILHLPWLAVPWKKAVAIFSHPDK